MSQPCLMTPDASPFLINKYRANSKNYVHQCYLNNYILYMCIYIYIDITWPPCSCSLTKNPMSFDMWMRKKPCLSRVESKSNGGAWRETHHSRSGFSNLAGEHGLWLDAWKIICTRPGKQTKNDEKTMEKPWENDDLYGKSPCFMGKSIISMVIFNSYVKLPKGIDGYLLDIYIWVCPSTIDISWEFIFLFDDIEVW